MQATQHFALVALVANFLLGGAVFALNPRRPASLSFLLLTTTFCAWLGAVALALSVRSPEQIALWIRVCSVAGAYWPAAFTLLEIAIIYHRESWLDHLRRAKWWLGTATAIGVFCLTPFFLESVHMVAVPGGMAPVPIYAWGGWAGEVLFDYLSAAFVLVALRLIRRLFDRRIVGVARAELQYLFLGCLVIVLDYFLNTILSDLGHSAGLNQYAPLRFVGFSVIIAYGISSRGILSMRSVFRRVLSHVLLACYAGLIFTASWSLLGWVFFFLGATSEFGQALFSSVAVALLVNTARSPLRRMAERLVPSENLDFEKMAGSISQIVQSVATFSELLDEFCSVMRRAVDTPHVTVFLLGPNTPADGPMRERNCQRLEDNDPLVVHFLEGVPDLAVEDMHRVARSPERDALLARMEALDAGLILPIRYHGKVSGLLALGSRASGRIYGRDGRATLRLLAEQLGVAIANARLYTEARQSQAYIQFLVDRLPCGVIATDPAGRLTLINPEARRLLQVDQKALPADIRLPNEIGRLIPPTLVGSTIARDEEIVLRPKALDRVHLLVSCLPFASEREEQLGAVLVINDHTEIERLQNQVRQSDRLASIGTLASGMAHEIKNPLTALKTFAQLLPKRFNDAEFRHDFSFLVGSEIARIERIVNELLAFARPAPLMIERVNLHELMDGAVRLVGPQASRMNVTLRKSLHAREDQIAADKDRLQQVLLNLLLNALQASSSGGSIELSTELQNGAAHPEPVVRVDVRDTGSGIPSEMLPHIFDPFFTTKSEGTGLGLSVSYNIIAEHRGRLEVQSEPGKGTCFSIYLPVDRSTAARDMHRPPASADLYRPMSPPANPPLKTPVP